MEKHFDRQHFLCTDPQCLAARFVVFENEIDLRHQEINIHGGTSTGSTKINLEFNVRREGFGGEGYEDQRPPTEDGFGQRLDGQAFVPDALPQQQLDATTAHPQHLQRTQELQAQAAQIRQQ